MSDVVKGLLDSAEEETVWDGGGHTYQLEHIVGNGAFGVVWRARADDGSLVAIKKVMLDRRYHNRELQMMKVMDHENIVRLRHYFEKSGRKKDETYLHLVMDFLPETIRSVALRHQKRSQRFSFDHIRAYLWQTFCALEYIHARRICHRDIKPDNLLCDPSTLQCRLCDFGCSKVLVKGQPNVSYICSRYYRAPELMFGATEYAVGVDVWSVGTILMELLLGHLPFQGQDSTQQHLVEIMKLLGTPTDRDLHAMRATCCTADLPMLKPFPWERIFAPNTPSEAIDLAQRLLRYDPDQRLSASQALKHPFFDGAEKLVRSNSSSEETGSSVPSQRGEIGFEQWEEGLNRKLKKLAGDTELISKVGQTIVRRLDPQLKDQPVSKELVGEVMGVVRQEVMSSLKALDERARGLHKSIVADAKQLRLQLPVTGRESKDVTTNAPMTEEEKKLEAELAAMREAKLKIDQAASEREELLARIKAALARGQPGNANQNEASEKASAEEDRPTTPGYGRRAPQPSRVQSFVTNSDSAPQPWQTDNMGQVTPPASFSSSEALPKSQTVQQRPSSGRRRGRLTEGGEVSEESPAETQIKTVG
mmetsp:Transcript_11302/g.25322  ORF Transcript_11302/g.25322 Transcript_11302/m.25322 type:complete len:592 (+) Transcript_11302:82-1857(+)